MPPLKESRKASASQIAYMNKVQGHTPLNTKQRKQVKAIVKGQEETKVYDSQKSLIATEYTGWVQSLTANAVAGTVMSQGVGNTNYIGGRVNPTFLYVGFQIENPATYNLTRVIILQAPGNNPPQISQVLQFTGNVRTPLSPYDWNHRDRFRVLADKRFLINNSITAGNASATYQFKIKGKKMRPINFADASGTIEDNGIYIYAWGDEALISGPAYCQYIARLYFKDA